MSELQTMWYFKKPKGEGLEEKYKKYFPVDDDDYIQTNDIFKLGGLCDYTHPTGMLQEVLKEHFNETQQKPVVSILYQENEGYPPCFFANIVKHGEDVMQVGIDPEFFDRKTKEIGIDWSDEDCAYDDKWDKFCDACDARLKELILAYM